MNARTTLTMALVLVGLIALYWVNQRVAVRSAAETTSAVSAPTVAQELIPADQLGDVVKIAVQKGQSPRLVFEKDAETAASGAASWRMTEPFSAKASGWEVDRIARDLKALKYEISHKAAGGSITPAEAGLATPGAIVTLTDAAGEQAAIEIGNPASATETYVRLAGADEIVVAKSNLRNLIKEKAVEYRDAQLWNFAPENVRRVEITDRKADGGPTTYTFVRDGSRWTMESPVAAKATDKVNEAITAVSRLRVMKWMDDAADRLPVYGLDPAALTWQVTVEEQVPVAAETAADDTQAQAEEAETQEPKTETRTTTYVLHVSSVSPIGEETKTYVRAGDETTVATIMTTTTDKLKPVMTEWRDMRVIPAEVDRATRIDISVGGESAALMKTGDGWAFESDGAPAEKPEVEALLTAMNNLRAVVFVDADESIDQGLKTSQAHVGLTIPGIDGTERLTIGGPTDQTAKMMVFARRNDSGSLAKVRSTDVVPILRPISVYRDRTVLQIDPAAVAAVTMHSKSPMTGEATTATFARENGGWTMTEPVAAAANEERLTQLMEAMANLKAVTVIASDAQPETYGLDDPDVRLTLKTTGPHGQAEESSDSAPQAIPRTRELSLAIRDSKYYAKVEGRPAIYEVAKSFYDQAALEYRSGKVVQFEPSDVTRFSVQQGDQTHTFFRKDSSWAYEAEPDLPLAANRIENLLLQIKDIQAQRFLIHSGGNPAAYGLDAPARRAAVVLQDGREITLAISGTPTQAPGAPGLFATTGSDGAIFMVPDDALQRIDVKLDELNST